MEYNINVRAKNTFRERFLSGYRMPFGTSGTTGIFGQGVTAVAPNTFHVECLNTNSAPLLIGALPLGTLAYFPAPAGLGFPAGSCIAMIR